MPLINSHHCILFAMPTFHFLFEEIDLTHKIVSLYMIKKINIFLGKGMPKNSLMII